jgi:putative ABC transport system permease protein
MNLWFDLKYAARLLNKSRGYSVMCTVVVALSIGLALWTNALLYSQLFKPLDFPGSGNWYNVQIAANVNDRARPGVDAYTWQELLKRNRSANAAGAFANRQVVLSEGQATTSLRGALMTPGLLKAMNVPPLHGRVFDERDAGVNAKPVAVISYDTWQSYFAGDPKIVGKTARIDANPVEIIGVMPQGFLVFSDYELWQPLELPKLARPGDSALTLYPFITLGEGQSADAIVAEMKPTVDAINREYPQLFNAARRVALIPGGKMWSHQVVPIVTMLSLMGVAVLILGGVNISMVFLARLLERSRELALRTALGSTRQRLLRQALLENALIVIAGLAGGWGLAVLGIRWTHGIGEVMRVAMGNGRSSNTLALRPFDFVIALGAAVIVWLLSTLVPAWRISKQDAAVVLAGSGKGATVRGSNKTVGLLVGLQVVISCLVLVTCGNVVLAVRQETTKATGLETDGVILSTRATEFDARHADPTRRLQYWDNLAAAIASKLPGSQTAFTTTTPLRPVQVPVTIETRQGADKQGALTLPLTVVSEHYFDVTGIELRAGRLFDSTDNRDSLHVAVADEQMAARFWPDGSAIGKRIKVNSSDDSPWLTIVGIVSNVPAAPYRVDADLGALYRPLRQAIPQSFHVLIKAPGNAGDARNAVKAAAFSVDRDVPLHNLQPLDFFIYAVRLGMAALIPVFITVSVITAMLAATGLFGLISRSVAQRTQEVGIRRALGATTWRATSMFLRQGAIYLSVAAAGLALGIAIMPALSRAIPNILDYVFPVTAGVVLLMAAVISTASYLPTRRAVALEPGDALRYE